MTYYIIKATESSFGAATAPHQDNIEQAFRAINQAWSDAAARDRLQPSLIYQPVRVTRKSSFKYDTTVAALASIEMRGRPERQVLGSVMSDVKRSLDNFTRGTFANDWIVDAVAYQPQVNGPVDFWTTPNRASNTQTRVEASILAVGPDENPVGPNDLIRTQRNLGAAAAQYAVARTDEAAAQSDANRQDLELPAAERRRREQEEKAHNQKMLMIGGGVIVVSLLAVAAIKYSGVAERLSKKLNPGKLPKVVEDYGKCVERWHRTGRKSDRDAAMRCKRDMSPAHKQLAVSVFGSV